MSPTEYQLLRSLCYPQVLTQRLINLFIDTPAATPPSPSSPLVVVYPSSGFFLLWLCHHDSWLSLLAAVAAAAAEDEKNDNDNITLLITASLNPFTLTRSFHSHSITLQSITNFHHFPWLATVDLHDQCWRCLTSYSVNLPPENQPLRHCPPSQLKRNIFWF